MKTWKLPNGAGGGEVEGLDEGAPTLPNHRAVLIDGWHVLFPKEALTEVKPPPVEPGLYAVRVVRKFEDRDFDVPFVHTSSGWFGATFTRTLTWGELLELDPEPQEFVPAPPVVELPFTLELRQERALVEVSHVIDSPDRPVYLCLASNGNAIAPTLTTEQARATASALWATADEADAAKAALPPPCGETWRDGVTCTTPDRVHLCELIGGHGIHRCVCGAVDIPAGAL